MKAAIFFLASITLVSAFKLENVKRATHTGECPLVDTNVLGFCMYDPAKNCLSDDQCIPTEKCCPSGCNKMCMTAVHHQLLLS
ncbi:antileukoproteinase-like [Saccostrea cucullata]|uniref:antileukoproteinase-like n=1 Tax=Saccostrea cuccullata TaxID=36930 RepID=UPI002ED594CD